MFAGAWIFCKPVAENAPRRFRHSTFFFVFFSLPLFSPCRLADHTRRSSRPRPNGPLSIHVCVSLYASRGTRARTKSTQKSERGKSERKREGTYRLPLPRSIKSRLGGKKGRKVEGWERREETERNGRERAELWLEERRVNSTTEYRVPFNPPRTPGFRTARNAKLRDREPRGESWQRKKIEREKIHF